MSREPETCVQARELSNFMEMPLHRAPVSKARGHRKTVHTHTRTRARLSEPYHYTAPVHKKKMKRKAKEQRRVAQTVSGRVPHGEAHARTHTHTHARTHAKYILPTHTHAHTRVPLGNIRKRTEIVGPARVGYDGHGQ